MSSITNVTTGSVSVADPLAIAFQSGGADVPVTAAQPLPITGSITTTQGPVQYVDNTGADVEVTEGSKPLPVSIESTIDIPAGPIEFQNSAGADTIVKAGNVLTALPIQSEGGTIDDVTTVGTVNSVTTLGTVNTVTAVGSVSTVGTVTTVSSVTDVANVQSVDLVDEVAKSVNYHTNAAGTEVATSVNAARGPVTERGTNHKVLAVSALDVGPAPGTALTGGQGVVFYTAPTWVRISHVSVRNDSTAGAFAFGLVGAAGDIAYSGEQLIKLSTFLPGASAFVPNAFTEPFVLGPGDQIAVWHQDPGATATVHVGLSVETLE
jgi:hypothetical protein